MTVPVLAERPAPPAWLLPLASSRWVEIVPQLMPVLTDLDLVALAKYCQCYAQYLQAQEWIAKNGITMTIRNDKGEVKSMVAVPHVGIAAKMLTEMHRYERQFGLTPLARAARLENSAGDMTDAELLRIAAYDPGGSEGGASQTRAG